MNQNNPAYLGISRAKTPTVTHSHINNNNNKKEGARKTNKNPSVYVTGPPKCTHKQQHIKWKQNQNPLAKVAPTALLLQHLLSLENLFLLLTR